MAENVHCYVVGGVVIGVLILVISLIATSLEKLDSDEGKISRFKNYSVETNAQRSWFR